MSVIPRRQDYPQEVNRLPYPPPVIKLPRNRRLRIYVAGPMTGSGHPYGNIYDGLHTANMILDRGMAPYIPHLTCILEMMTGLRNRNDWLELDRAFLLTCDALIRLPGASPGADEEVKWALEAGIVVHLSLDTLFAWQETQR